MEVPEDFEVMMVRLILQSRFPLLPEPQKLIQIDRVAVRHDQPMKRHGKPFLLLFGYLPRFAQNPAALRDHEQVALM